MNSTLCFVKWYILRESCWKTRCTSHLFIFSFFLSLVQPTKTAKSNEWWASRNIRRIFLPFFSFSCYVLLHRRIYIYIICASKIIVSSTKQNSNVEIFFRIFIKREKTMSKHAMHCSNIYVYTLSLLFLLLSIYINIYVYTCMLSIYPYNRHLFVRKNKLGYMKSPFTQNNPLLFTILQTIKRFCV